MQNVIYAVIGVILTVAAMYMVSPSISASSEAIQAGMISTEVGAIKNASKMWLANSSSDGTYAAITEEDISTLVPDLVVTGGKLDSKTSGVTHDISVVSLDSGINNGIEVVIAGLTASQQPIVKKNVDKFDIDGNASSTTTSVTVQIKG